jgi:phosphonate transport system substrate-binding protein
MSHFFRLMNWNLIRSELTLHQIAILVTILPAFVLLLCLPSPARAEDIRPLELGVVPNLSARVLLVQYQPLRQFLERELNRPVRLSTATSWLDFDQRMKKHELDIAVTSANWARLAQLDLGYEPIGAWMPNLKGYIVHEKKKPLTTINDLRGKSLAMSNEYSIVAMQGLKWLQERNLVRNKDFKTTRAAADDSVGHLILRGDAIAALCSNGEFKNIPEDVRNQLEIFTEVADVSAFIALTSPKISAEETKAIRAAFVKFVNEAEEGKTFFSQTGIKGMLWPNQIDMKALDSFVQETRRVASEPR